MYEFISQISNVITSPIINIARGFEATPLLFAFFLGLVGAAAPCQFTGNIGAVTLFGNKSVQKEVAWADTAFFILGKMVAFTSLGLLIWILGREVQQQLTSFFPILRKLIGPMLIIVGLFMLGFIKFKWSFNIIKLPNERVKSGKMGSFLLGTSFSLAFCPTMFVLFFVTLMPVVLATPYGFVLPSVFAIGTSLPVIVAVFLIWYFGLSGTFMKKGRKIGLYVQRTAGIILIILGILDTITYWTL